MATREEVVADFIALYNSQTPEFIPHEWPPMEDADVKKLLHKCTYFVMNPDFPDPWRMCDGVIHPDVALVTQCPIELVLQAHRILSARAH